MRGVGRLVALVITVAVLGCAPASETDLTGTWQMADRSREYLPEEQREAEGRLTLFADGSFSAFELPVLVGQSTSGHWPAERKPALLTGSGTWKIDRAGGQIVRLSIETASEDYPGIVPYGYIFAVHPAFGRDSRYSLVDFWGDPDAVPGIFFEKERSSENRVQ